MVHEGDSLAACRRRGGFVSGKPPSLLVLGTEKTLALKAAEGRHRARNFRPPRGAGFARLVLLAGSLTLSSGSLPHCCGAEGEVRRALMVVELEGDEQMGIRRKKMEMWQDLFTELPGQYL